MNHLTLPSRDTNADRSVPPGTTRRPTRRRVSWTTVVGWFDAEAAGDRVTADAPDGRRTDWVRILPFLTLHAACLLVLLVGWSPVAAITAGALYLVRMFAVTGFYHRYFSHRTFKTNRVWQFVFAVAGNTAVQRGPLWWAAHHRKHHRHADHEGDSHSPRRDGFWWSHVGWFTSRAHFHTDLSEVKDLARFPELRFLDRFSVLVPIGLAVSIYAAGATLEAYAPHLGTNGLQLFVWGFCISTVVLLHATFTINSLAHTVGSRRYATRDDSRNNPVLAAITLGEGWHNNHHHYPASTRQGFYWWEVDVTFYILKLLSWLGIVRDLKPVPVRVRARRAADRETERGGRDA